MEKEEKDEKNAILLLTLHYKKELLFLRSVKTHKKQQLVDSDLRIKYLYNNYFVWSHPTYLIGIIKYHPYIKTDVSDPIHTCEKTETKS